MGAAALEARWWPSQSAPRQWWRYGRQHKLQRWFGLDNFLVLLPQSYSRRLLVSNWESGSWARATRAGPVSAMCLDEEAGKDLLVLLMLQSYSRRLLVREDA